jgi:hypothetical protein
VGKSIIGWPSCTGESEEVFWLQQEKIWWGKAGLSVAFGDVTTAFDDVTTAEDHLSRAAPQFGIGWGVIAFVRAETPTFASATSWEFLPVPTTMSMSLRRLPRPPCRLVLSAGIRLPFISVALT